MKIFKEEFHNAKVQRYQVHVSRNVLCKVPRKMKQEVPDSLRDIFYAPSKKKSLEEYEKFVEKYKPQVPSAVQSLRNSIDSCLAFYSLPKEL